jgi:hypothetical protein
MTSACRSHHAPASPFTGLHPTSPAVPLTPYSQPCNLCSNAAPCATCTWCMCSFRQSLALICHAMGCHPPLSQTARWPFSTRLPLALYGLPADAVPLNGKAWLPCTRLAHRSAPSQLFCEPGRCACAAPYLHVMVQVLHQGSVRRKTPETIHVAMQGKQ